MSFLQQMFRRDKASAKVQHAASVSAPGLVTFSSVEADRVANQMGEKYYRCPKCGTCERINNVGKMMLTVDPTYLTGEECAKCHHAFNARVALKSGLCPGYEYDEDGDIRRAS